MIHLVLLSGGSGSRLWPLSNSARSKQFLKVLRDEDGHHVSMVQRVFDQIANVGAIVDITIATSAVQEASIRSQVPGGYALVLEPEKRDTASAIMLACAHLDLVQGASLADTVVIMPIDTYADQTYYNGITKLDAVVQSGMAKLVLQGANPTYPSEKYGYIVTGTNHESYFDVERFIEKPTVETAESLIKRGALWNCGVFAFKLGYLRNITKQYFDVASYDAMVAEYTRFPKNSFDYEVVEKATSIAVIPYSGSWKDLGTWNTLCEEMKDASSGRTIGIETCENTHVINELGIPMVALGLKDVAVVATSDGILVSDKNASSYMKPYVERIAEDRPMYESRLWGEYRVLDTGAYNDGSKSLTKELTVRSGRQLSYQRHSHRSEIWTVVAGSGEVVLDGHVTPVMRGTVINIRQFQMHAARALEEDLHIIEVQIGDPLIEEDIERFGNYWHD